MSTRITEVEGVVALYDSTSGFAFGPVFQDEDEAADFLEFFKEWSADKPFDDVRQLTDEEWKPARAAFDVWVKEKYGDA